MSSTQFVEMYHPLIPSTATRPALVAAQAVDERYAKGWLLVDPDALPPAPATPYYTTAAADSRFVQDAQLATKMAGHVGDGSAFDLAQRAASDARYAKGSLAGLPLRGVQTAATTVQPFDVLADGWLYGAAGTVINRSNDSGVTWTPVVDVGSGTQITGLRDLGNGEVLVLTQAGPLLRSVGWASNKATATFTTAIAAPGVSYFLPWGVSTNPATGRALATTYVASGDWTSSSKVWLSQDHGVTWTVVFDLAVNRPTVDNATSHMHLTAIDPRADDRLWTVWHDSGTQQEVLYSDDLGATWAVLTNQFQPTVGIPTDKGMVFGSDEGPNGIYVAPRTADPADMTYDLAWEWRGNIQGILGFANRGFRDPATGLVYVAFIANAGHEPVIGVSDGASASQVWRDIAVTTNGDGVRNVVVHDGHVVALLRRDAAHSTLRAPVVTAAARDPRTHDDTGWALGGRATADGATAVGPGSAASGVNSVAAGRGATATGTSGVSVGATASTSSTNSVAVGSGATAGANGTATGATATATTSSVAVGVAATATTDSVSAGRDTFTRNRDVAVGRLAKQTNAAGGTGGTAVGYDAQVVSGGSAVGISTRANLQDATALGARAVAGHVRSVALGSDTTTTAADQVMVGGRDIEITDAAKGAVLKSPDGTRYRITVANGGALTVTAL